MKTKVAVIRVIQLRTEYIDSDGKVRGWNKKFQKPTVAAEHWAQSRVQEWEDRKFDVANQGAAYHRMIFRDWEERDAREKKLYRRSLPIFKRMLGQ
jgi:hypothetical protein